MCPARLLPRPDSSRPWWRPGSSSFQADRSAPPYHAAVEPPVPIRPPDDSGDHPYAASRGALIGAFVAVVVAGLSGAAIGFGLVDIGCTGDCGTVSGLSALFG